MSNIAVPNTFVAGTLAQAAQVNANFTEIQTKFNTYAVQTDVSATITVAHTFNVAPVFGFGTASQALELDASKNVQSVAITGTGNYVKSASPTFTGTITAAAITASGLIQASAGQVIAGTIALAATSAYIMRAAAGQIRTVRFETDNSLRWAWTVTATAESGANAGSDIALYAYTDGAALIDAVIAIPRVAGGAIALGRPVTVAGTITLTSTAATQLAVAYDGSNSLGVSVSSSGTVTFNATGGTPQFLFSDQLVVQTTSIPAFASINTAGIQGSFRYDASNRCDITVGSSGITTFDAVGAGASFVFSDSVTVNNATPILALSISGSLVSALTHVSSNLRINTESGQGAINLATNGTTTRAQVPASVSAGDVWLGVYDETGASLKQVSRGAADSGGAGYRVLRIAN